MKTTYIEDFETREGIYFEKLEVKYHVSPAMASGSYDIPADNNGIDIFSIQSKGVEVDLKGFDLDRIEKLIFEYEFE